jgi:cyanate permease
MAQRRKPKKPSKPAESKSERRQGSLDMRQRNVAMLFAGIVLIAIGYLLLGRGSITAAPLLLVLGYCVVVPLSIILWVKRTDNADKREAGE